MPFKVVNPRNTVSDNDEVADGKPSSSDTPFGDIDPASQLADKERIVYTYHLNACSVHLQIIIAVEPVDPHSGQHTFTLSVKAGGLERTLCDPVVMKLFCGPRQLDFAAFIFPPKLSLPSDCLYHLRVWLRNDEVDHRLFADNELWLGMNPDFRAIGDASFAQLTGGAPFTLIYQGLVGRARVNFIVRWNRSEEEEHLYKISLEYEAGGVGSILFDDYSICLDTECDPQAIAFVIYTVPITSTPPNASHRLRLWIRTPASSSSPASSLNSLQNPSFIYQRLWKSDSFKLGSGLNFEVLSKKFVMGVRDARGPRIESIPQKTPTVGRTPQWIGENRSLTTPFDTDNNGNVM